VDLEFGKKFPEKVEDPKKKKRRKQVEKQQWYYTLYQKLNYIYSFADNYTA